MKKQSGLVLLAFVIEACALGSSSAWPRWADELTKRLQCGMTIEEVRNLSESQILELKAGPAPTLGRYYIRKWGSDLWLRFNDEGLEAVTMARVDGWRILAMRTSPRRNLCTGELAFVVRVLRTRDLEGASFYLDGNQVEMIGNMIEMPAGRHELVIEKPGFEPIVREFQLGPEDRGDQRLDLTSEKLRPVTS